MKIENKFGPLSDPHGKLHTFLGMNFTLNDNGKVSINMREYIQEAIDVFGEDVSTPVKSISLSDLFEIDENSRPLSENKQGRFHSVVAKLL